MVLRGAGQGATRLVIATPSADNGQIRFEGGAPGALETITNQPTRGSATIQLASTQIAVGDVVKVLDAARGLGFGFENYAQIGRVVAKSGGTLTLDQPLGLDFIISPRVRKLNPIRNVAVESLTVFRDRAASSARATNIFFVYADRAYARDVESSYLERGGITFAGSIDVHASNNRIHHAYDYGGGGQAYGIRVTESTSRCNIVDNKAWELRHHIILDLGANHCVVAYNSAEAGYNGVTGDLSHHGFSNHNNLWEGNMGRYLKWDGRSETNAAEYQGLYNTAYRNLLYGSNNTILLDGPDTSGNFNHQSPTIIGNVARAYQASSGVVSPFVGANRRERGSYLGLGKFGLGLSRLPLSHHQTGLSGQQALAGLWAFS